MLKKMGFLVLFLWIIGAFASGVINNYKVKKECIESEGFVKGWFFCRKESNNSFALEMAKGGFGHFYFFITLLPLTLSP